MVDKSWGTSGSPGLRVRTNLTLDERAAVRAEARAARAAARSEAGTDRSAQQAADREAEMQRRERDRQARREADMQNAATAAADPHAAAARRHRGSGRKDIVRDQRDTRGYTTVVDRQRIRELAKRGASLGGLAAAFGISIEEVEQALAAPLAD